jgi:hypothetical protein
MPLPSEMPPLRCADQAGTYPAEVFDGTSFVVSSIDETLTLARTKLAEVSIARMDQSLEAMIRAHAELAKLLAQAAILSESLGRVLKFHAERQKQKLCPHGHADWDKCPVCCH